MAVSQVPVPGIARLSLAALPPLSLYIHIPWCVRKCPYCDFNSHEIRVANTKTTSAVQQVSFAEPVRTQPTYSDLPEAKYIRCLMADLEQALPKIWGRRIATIFFGGGTPSLLSAQAIDTLLSALRARLNLDPEAEITLEANPGTFEIEKFRGFRAAGINRLSIGIQSLNASHLHTLGRIHNADEAKRAIDIAQTYFDNVNLDLMYGLPAQTLAECVADIDTALSYAPAHLSLYHLTLEPNTLFHRFPPVLPDDELAADMQAMITQKLRAAGYDHYETSAYAQPGKRSRHNLNYWRFGDYVGIGAGAHGKISFPDRIVREIRYKQPKTYMQQALQGTAIQKSKDVSPHELPFEFMMNALRLTDGFQIALFTERTGLPITIIKRELAIAESRGLLTRDHLKIKPTERGQLFLNDLLQIFLSPAECQTD